MPDLIEIITPAIGLSNSVVFADNCAIAAGLACVPVFGRLDFFQPVKLADVF